MRSLPHELRDPEGQITTEAEEGAERRCRYGPDLDLSIYPEAQMHEAIEVSSLLPWGDREAAGSVGVEIGAAGRAGTFLQLDRSAILAAVVERQARALELCPLADAVERYDGLPDHVWRLVSPGEDKYTSLAARREADGYFLRVRAGCKVGEPIQACLLLAEDRTVQLVHNVVVLEPGSEAHIITGCTRRMEAEQGLHIGISELFVGEGARLTVTMVHRWGEGFDVRPRTGAVVAAGGLLVSNYVLLSPARSVQTWPVCRLSGPGSQAVFKSLLYGLKGSYLDVGATVVLEASATRAETRGFFDLDLPGLPRGLKESVDRLLEETARESL